MKKEKCPTCGVGDILVSGLTRQEERLLLAFCISENFPRKMVIPRTGTEYNLFTNAGAQRLWKALNGSRRGIAKPELTPVTT